MSRTWAALDLRAARQAANISPQASFGSGPSVVFRARSCRRSSDTRSHRGLRSLRALKVPQGRLCRFRKISVFQVGNSRPGLSALRTGHLKVTGKGSWLRYRRSDGQSPGFISLDPGYAREQTKTWIARASPAMMGMTMDSHWTPWPERPADRYCRERSTENSPLRMRGARFSA